MPSKDVPLKAENLSKSYGDFQALESVSFEVGEGKCIGLLGPNGAGKTTTMRMIMGLSEPSGGILKVFGKNISTLTKEDKTRIGLVPQEDNLDPDLTVLENLLVYGSYFGLSKELVAERAEKLLEFMSLTEKRDATVRALSGGMKRRLVIARALINDPDFIILDEPTTGLDPQARVLIWKRLQELKKQGKTLLLTTHYMDEAERLCDNIVIIDGGKVLDEGTPKVLTKRHVKAHVFEVVKPVNKKLSAADLDNEDIGESILFYVEQVSHIEPLFTEKCSYMRRHSNLEDVFLRLTGRQLRKGG